MPSAKPTITTGSIDPLDEALRPPPGETPDQRLIRELHEQEARAISHRIDQELKAEEVTLKKTKRIRLLLLGQSESGKSTTLRHFQRLYTPSAFQAERYIWRAIVQLNICRSIRTVLDALAAESDAAPAPRSSDGDHNSTFAFGMGDNGDISDDEDESGLPAHLERLRVALLPVRHVEALLIAKLVPPNETEAMDFMGAPKLNGQDPTALAQRQRTQEVFVRPTTSWKGALSRSPQRRSQSGSARPSSAGSEVVDEAQEVLNSCRHDIEKLWRDPFVQNVLKKRKIRLHELPGFFLDDLERVTALPYLPTDDDVLRARLKTVGVSEYKFELEAAAGRESGTEWRIIDVGGSRSQRPVWVSFFDNVHAIIFLAPISGFDQVLAEDRTVNRLEDSVLLWKAVCSNKLLAKVDLILFLNKCDILEQKLKSGIRLSKYVKSYADRPNEIDYAIKYFKGKFNAIHREYSPNPRKFYAFATSVTDTNTTAGILASVRDMLVRQNLTSTRML